MDGILYWIEFWQRELLLFSAIWFLIGALDDLVVDLIWGIRWFVRRLTYYRFQAPMRAAQLPPPETLGILAIFIATWQEAAVIGAMLAQCQKFRGIASPRYRIYVGCYPNDHAGIAEIMKAAAADRHVRLILTENPGPTTKADCLNRLWQALISDELAEGMKAKAVILHDAEDMVHPDELRVFDRLIERNQAVQLPVIPARVAGSIWISGHYLDEFAEAHGKSLVVREAIGAALPLAGVGCAIDRGILGRIAVANYHQPFDSSSLTEDYEIGLRIGAQGGRTIFARMADSDGNLVGTRACFPDTISASVRQKSRWLTGIALAGWDRMGWQGGMAETWMRLRDRRALLAALVLCTAYACIVLTAILGLAWAFRIYQPQHYSMTLINLLWINSGFLVWRLCVRAAFVGAVYGPTEAALSVPRTFVANIIGIMAARRGCAAYLMYMFGGRLAWDKTAHRHFPNRPTANG